MRPKLSADGTISVEEYRRLQNAKPANKYGAKKVSSEHGLFDSEKEHRRYCELLLMQERTLIDDLARQVSFPLIVGNARIGRYTADFIYTRQARLVVEDVKGMQTQAWKRTEKLFRACYPHIMLIVT